MKKFNKKITLLTSASLVVALTVPTVISCKKTNSKNAITILKNKFKNKNENPEQPQQSENKKTE
ncbi:hypothetical protein [Mesomycoplasma lagogenitalium]|uniref:Lipoprotein n=1 Tax=Mesomycoplasma lagogenitalium TaxID=171286 RepID=A0ABY8LTA5_9BACT|nr:hypothetical protein [Mesomycoplasma lagogenitalium]WGI36474.1 hypothetical protein QEG99_03345 [Mesomycoplasma lagogenitalium]